MNKNKFKQDFEYYTGLILSENNFAYARYADGQVRLMKGQSIGANTQAFISDKWSSPAKLTQVGRELQQTLSHLEENYHYAISAHSDSVEDFTYLRERIHNKNITFANLWINANYQKMKKFYFQLKKECYVICHHSAKSQNFPFPVKEVIPFPNDCVRYWEGKGKQYLARLNKRLRNLSNQTFLISAGPVSQIIIDYLFKQNINNKYIDVGSSLDEFIHKGMTRPFMDSSSPYAKEISYFYE